MEMKKSGILPVLIVILFSWGVKSVTYSGNWGVTQFEEVKLQYTWIINNFELVTLLNQSTNNMGPYIDSPSFSPPGNETFKWCLRLYPRSNSRPGTDMLFVILNENYDTINVNYTISVGSKLISGGHTFTFQSPMAGDYLAHEDAFKSCLPNGTLIVNCEIRAISNVIEASGSNFDKCSSMRDETLRSKIDDDFLTLLRYKTFSDITIKLQEYEISAHKIILAARSPVLASSIMENSTVNNNGNSSFLEIKDVEPMVFKRLLQYIYTDKVDDVDINMAKNLLVAAIKYDIKGLKAICEEILCSGMSDDNAIEILEIADKYYIRELKLQASEFIVERADAVMKSTGFTNLELSKPHPMYDIFRMMAYKSVINHG